MPTVWLIASLHLTAVAIAFGAITTRAAALRRLRDPSGLRTVFLADNVWGLTALVLIGTGLARVFGATDKGAAYYMNSDAFWLKMSLLGAILLLEIWPMITLIRWRVAQIRARPFELRSTAAFYRISVLQALLLIAMIFAATAMARGIFY